MTRSSAAAFQSDVGLEVHVQLKTASKIWCGCPNRYGSPANSDVCPVCLGYPGSLPVMNRHAVELTVKTGLMGMIREASPAAVHFMPCMKRSWYAIVPSSPSHTV